MDAPLTDATHESPPSPAAVTANPAPPGPGLAPGNAERTALQHDPGSVGGGTIARPERYLVVPRYVDEGAAGAGDDQAPRYVFARWEDWPHPTMLALSPPAVDETLDEAVARLLWARLGARTTSAPRLGAPRIPVRMMHPRTGVDGLGWLRPVAVTVSGELTADALLAGFAVLTAEEADAALSTDVERAILAEAVALFA